MRKLKTLGSYPLRDDSRLGFVYNSEISVSCREREKGVAVEKRGEDMAPGILGFLCFTTRSRQVAAAGRRLNDLIVGGCNDRAVLPNGPEMAPPAFLDVDAAVRG